MKIGIVASLFPPYSVGGAEISAYYLSKGLAKAGHDVLVITPSFDKKDFQEEKYDFKIYRFGIGSKQIRDSLKKITKERSPRFPFTSMSHPVLHSYFKEAIKSIAKEFKPDILHTQHSQAFIPTYNSVKNVKKVATLRDYTTYCDSGFCSLNREYKKCSFFEYLLCKRRWDKLNSRSPKLYKHLYNYRILKKKQNVLRKMNGVISVSGFVRDVYKKIGVESTVIHNIAPEEKVVKSVSKIKKELGVSGKIVSYVGKISIGKGANQFLDMVRILKDEGVNFIVAGTGPLEKDFDRASKEYENLIYRRHVPHEKALEIYKASDIVCSTSVWPEPLSRVIIEALSLGTPCVATNVGGTEEIIEDCFNGFLVSPENVEELVDKVNILLSNKKLRERFAKNGKIKIRKEFSTDKITNEHINFYKRVLGG
ncbi:MAG: glycosyltransferase family 4 protein [Candidatus Aenigmarchaeota archaeon]|nr:glycosyltransferase family 4 protein [Candidatus Aenigmarchaeota archaeon]